MACPSQSCNCVITECYWLALSLKARVRLQIEIVAFCIRPTTRLMLFIHHHGISLGPSYSACFCFYLQWLFCCCCCCFFLSETLYASRLYWDVHAECILSAKDNKCNLIRTQHFCTLLNFMIQFQRHAFFLSHSLMMTVSFRTERISKLDSTRGSTPMPRL